MYLENSTRSVVVKTLCYKPESRVFDTRWRDFFNLSHQFWVAGSIPDEVIFKFT
jgi:hypothetical protein